MNIKIKDISYSVPLRELAKINVFNDWVIYGEIDETS